MGFYIPFLTSKSIKLAGDPRVVSEALWTGFYYWSKLYKIRLFYIIQIHKVNLNASVSILNENENFEPGMDIVICSKKLLSPKT